MKKKQEGLRATPIKAGCPLSATLQTTTAVLVVSEQSPRLRLYINSGDWCQGG